MILQTCRVDSWLPVLLRPVDFRIMAVEEKHAFGNDSNSLVVAFETVFFCSAMGDERAGEGFTKSVRSFRKKMTFEMFSLFPRILQRSGLVR